MRCCKCSISRWPRNRLHSIVDSVDPCQHEKLSQTVNHHSGIDIDLHPHVQLYYKRYKPARAMTAGSNDQAQTACILSSLGNSSNPDAGCLSYKTQKACRELNFTCRLLIGQITKWRVEDSASIGKCAGPPVGSLETDNAMCPQCSQCCAGDAPEAAAADPHDPPWNTPPATALAGTSGKGIKALACTVPIRLNAM